MGLKLLVIESWRIARANQTIWILGFLDAVFYYSIKVIPTGFPLGCLNIPFLIGLLISSSALIYVVFQARLGKSLPLRQAWQRGIELLPNIFVANLLMIIPLLFFGIMFRIIALGFQIQQGSIIEWLIRMISLIPFGRAFYSFAFCGIIINGLAPLKSIGNSILVTVNNFVRVVLLMAIFAAVEYALIALVIIVWDPANWSVHLSRLPYISPDLPVISNWSPLAWGMRVIGSTPLSVFGATVYTLAYIQFTKEIEYPGSVSKQSREI